MSNDSLTALRRSIADGSNLPSVVQTIDSEVSELKGILEDALETIDKVLSRLADFSELMDELEHDDDPELPYGADFEVTDDNEEEERDVQAELLKSLERNNLRTIINRQIGGHEIVTLTPIEEGHEIEVEEEELPILDAPVYHSTAAGITSGELASLIRNQVNGVQEAPAFSLTDHISGQLNGSEQAPVYVQTETFSAPPAPGFSISPYEEAPLAAITINPQNDNAPVVQGPAPLTQAELVEKAMAQFLQKLATADDPAIEQVMTAVTNDGTITNEITETIKQAVLTSTIKKQL